MKKIIIFGTGGNCIDILDSINEINVVASTPVYECLGFFDDNTDNHGKNFNGATVIGSLSDAKNYPDAFFVNGIGSSKNFLSKESIINKSGMPLDRFETIIHPSAIVSKTATLGRGNVILQGVVIASNVKIGNHVIILPNSVISHDDIIGDYTAIGGGVNISGGVQVGKNCYIGTNSAIIGNVTLGDNCMIGMGSTVIRRVEPNTVVIGNPAKFLRITIRPSE